MRSTNRNTLPPTGTYSTAPNSNNENGGAPLNAPTPENQQQYLDLIDRACQEPSLSDEYTWCLFTFLAHTVYRRATRDGTAFNDEWLKLQRITQDQEDFSVFQFMLTQMREALSERTSEADDGNEGEMDDPSNSVDDECYCEDCLAARRKSGQIARVAQRVKRIAFS